MNIFISKDERRYWIYVLIVLVGIGISLSMSRPINTLIVNPDFQVVLFVTGMLLAIIGIILYGVQRKASRYEFATWLGLSAVLIFLEFRLGAAERSHLMEYGVLTVLIDRALTERWKNSTKHLLIALAASLIASFIGVTDELIQYFIPDRVMDYEDMIFNGGVSFAAGLGSFVLKWLRWRLVERG